MRKLLILLITVTVPSAFSQNSRPIKAFTLTQTLPLFGAGNDKRPIYRTSDQQTLGAQDRVSTTYHGNVFGNKISATLSKQLDDDLNDLSNEKGILSGDRSHLGGLTASTHESYGDFGGGSYFGNKLYNGFLESQKHCPVEKYALDGDGVIEYHSSLPKLEQFTLCAWMRFTNHSGDHTIFTYSVKDEPREIQLWIANANKQSFISMSVHGQSLFRLNYPLKMLQWHHMCGSWNGKTGEWQLWVKAERVGRGFHNRLVNHVLEPHGVAFSGGPSITGPVANGHHFELTMVQMYKVALSAGKAHRDHKHHHVHHFDHNGPIEPTTPAPTPAPQPTQPANPLLANGQILQRVPFNLAMPPQQPALPVQGVPSQLVGQHQLTQPQATITHSFANGQLNVGSRLLQEQLVSGQPQALPFQSSAPSQNPVQSTRFVFGDSFGDLSASGLPSHLRLRKRKTHKREVSRQDKKLSKRGLVMLKDGSIVDDSLLSVPGLFDGLTQFGVPEFKEDAVMKQNDLEDEIKEHDREPAEGEVQAVMSLCSKCQVEPFQGAILLSWRELQTSTKGVLKALSTGSCGDF